MISSSTKSSPRGGRHGGWWPVSRQPAGQGPATHLASPHRWHAGPEAIHVLLSLAALQGGHTLINASVSSVGASAGCTVTDELPRMAGTPRDSSQAEVKSALGYAGQRPDGTRLRMHERR